MQEEFLPIEGFEDLYEISNMGRVVSVRTGGLISASFNKQNVMRVNLVKDGRVYNRSINLLVINAFDPHWSERFNSVINLDGDRSNNCLDNLVARPRWFTIKYNRMFLPGYTAKWNRPIRDTATGFEYPNSLAAAKTFGLLDSDITLAIPNRTYVFPTNQIFEDVLI